MSELLEMTIRGEDRGQTYINRLNVIADLLPSTFSLAMAVSAAYGFDPDQPGDPIPDTLAGDLCLMGTASFRINEVVVRNIYTPTDLFTMLTPGAGWVGTLSAGGATLPVFVSAKLRTNRVRSDVRRGTMSLVAPVESVVDDNGIISGVFLNYMGDVCNRLNATYSHAGIGETVTFRTCVVGKERYAVPGYEPPRYAYRYYSDKATQMGRLAQSVVFEPVTRVSSQVSRKFGHGQ